MSKQSTTETRNIELAADIGNSKIKMIFDRDVKNILREDSVMREISSAPTVDETDINKLVQNLFDELLVHITSPAIQYPGLFTIGKRALKGTGGYFTNMNIRTGNKGEQDLPIVNLLSYIAAKGVKDHYNEQGQIPSALTVDCALTTAIPASQYSAKKAKQMEERFSKHTHIVVVYIGDVQSTVRVTFKRHIKVTREGVPALYAILEGPAEYFENYNELYETKITSGKVFADKKMLHTDIGDGTTESVYTEGMKPISDACTGEDLGVGHATEEALRSLNDKYDGKFKLKRQQLMAIIQDESDKYHTDALKALEMAKRGQSREILNMIQTNFQENTGMQASILPVYGGGSIIFKDTLYEPLKEFAKKFKLEVLWIPEKYAADLNALGLNILNTKVFLKDENKVQTVSK
ncbi:ParM/StbA family protein [Bacillus pumilus]|uniref:ParM/StbA family protein n=1 Tax=Bacillus pumilus TaxID=1408 RepID=UPI00119DF1BD|nr:ParM/StbA family protein [Bacillus pumilus]